MALAMYLLCFNVILYIKNKNYIVVFFNNENFKRFAILIQIFNTIVDLFINYKY